MTRYLFTGFGPFGEVDYNPSWDCAQAAAEASSSQAHLLEVTFGAARSVVDLLANVDLAVHFGVAVSRDDVCLERYAHNWKSDGNEPVSRIDADGPIARESSFPLDRLADELCATSEFRWRVSHDAGTYVCNATLYHSLSVVPDALFVHVPVMQAPTARTLGAQLARWLAQAAGGTPTWRLNARLNAARDE